MYYVPCKVETSPEYFSHKGPHHLVDAYNKLLVNRRTNDLCIYYN
jgi:hypothetical protein